MKANEIKLRLVKIDGVNVFFGKGVFNTETALCLEKSGKFGKKHTSTYAITSSHIKRSGNKSYCLIDLGKHISIGENSKNKSSGTSIDLNSEKNMKIINQIQHLTQRRVWEAHAKKMKYSIWQTIILLFSGMGIMAFIVNIIRALGVMF